MTRLAVHSCGPAVTVQDRGRPGALRMGISSSGAMDMRAFRLANALVGAEPNAAVLEFGLFGGRFSVDTPALVAVTGGNCVISVDGRAVPPWSSFRLEAGAILHVSTLSDAVYGYIAIENGIDVPQFMDSRATHSRSGLGGFQGRSLMGGDQLPFRQLNAPGCPLRVSSTAATDDRPIRVVAGPQEDYFTAAAWEVFLAEAFIVTDQRDRMGMNLEGPAIEHSKGYNIVSDAISFGSIQVPGSGSPLILLADRQTTGGYPKIATVISSDLGRLVQMCSRRAIRFEIVSASEAEDIAIAENAAILAEIGSLQPITAVSPLWSETLLSLNLIGGVVAPDEF